MKFKEWLQEETADILKDKYNRIFDSLKHTNKTRDEFIFRMLEIEYGNYMSDLYDKRFNDMLDKAISKIK